jgi:hypothetical protein
MPSVHQVGRVAGSLLAALLITLLATQVAVAAAPGSSGVVSRFWDAGGFSYYDAADGLTALGGPPPEEGCFGEGFDDPAFVTLVEMPSGALKVTIRQGPTPIFVYEGTVDDICGTILGGGAVEPLYVGSVSSVLTDNDGQASLTRVNAFGSASHGTVWDAAGNPCAFSAHVRMQVTLDGVELVRSQDINISC